LADDDGVATADGGVAAIGGVANASGGMDNAEAGGVSSTASASGVPCRYMGGDNDERHSIVENPCESTA
jgi:hypothetical protein